MAYLDKDGVPRVSDRVKLHNNRVDKLIGDFSDIQMRLNQALSDMPDENAKTDPIMLEHLHQCCILLEKCKERCQLYYQFG